MLNENIGKKDLELLWQLRLMASKLQEGTWNDNSMYTYLSHLLCLHLTWKKQQYCSRRHHQKILRPYWAVASLIKFFFFRRSVYQCTFDHCAEWTSGMSGTKDAIKTKQINPNILTGHCLTVPESRYLNNADRQCWLSTSAHTASPLEPKPLAANDSW